jgi:hypothetical protein
MVDTVIKHDPKGLVQHDMKYLRSVFKEKRYSPKDTHADIMFREGQQQVLDFIERELIAKR